METKTEIFRTTSTREQIGRSHYLHVAIVWL